ncbi:MAG: hypothetical protein IPG04_29060 [Polyangiaceae bacterium]|nr:hypothetical protein [Polyangiaceae bacterium]
MKRSGLAFGLTMALTATSGRAEEVPAEPVVVLVYGATDEFGLRLEAELRSIGVKVEPRRHAARTQPPGTIAVVTVSRRGGRRVEIRMGGHPSMQGEADLVVSVDDVSDPLGSIQAAERVRAAFEPLALRPPSVEPAPEPVFEIVTPPPALPSSPPPWPSPPPPASPGIVIELGVDGRQPRWPAPPPLPTRERWSFGLSAGLGAMFGSQGPSMETTLSFVAAPVRWFRVEPFVTVPLLPSVFEDDAGVAEVYAGALGVRVGFTVLEVSFFSLALGGGVEALWLRAVGEPAAGYVGTTEDAFTGAVFADLSPRFAVLGPLSLVPRATLGVALAPADVVFDGETVGVWGMPFGDLNLAIEATWSP